MDVLTTVTSTLPDKIVLRMVRSIHRAVSVIERLDGCPLSDLVERLPVRNQYLVVDAIDTSFFVFDSRYA